MFGDFSIMSSCISETAKNSEKYFMVPNPLGGGLRCDRIEFSDFELFLTFSLLAISGGKKGVNCQYLKNRSRIEHDICNAGRDDKSHHFAKFEQKVWVENMKNSIWEKNGVTPKQLVLKI